ncbi:MAG: hypothetical protein JOZ78_09205 [Chroococcidiopsidaceae cyanobacterium CP_BM_ER_R8_30]|nr:hypothetical protein [Chroococcidiopsidaceae cyanobacterium CP_BM_ER_R8_30]
MSNWLKAMRTVVGIVLASFSMATVTTLLDEVLNVQRQVIPDLDLSRESSLSAQTITTGRTIAFKRAEIDLKQAMELMTIPNPARCHGQIFSTKSPFSQFLDEREVAFDSFHSLHSLSKVQPQ